MTPQEQEKIWRDRFIAINLVRIGGTIVALFGLYISASDLIQPGGATIPGLALAIAGVLVAFGGPIWLARKWRTPPGP
jgi:multisubunit Na+/H+ antiporter MnhB subunit